MTLKPLFLALLLVAPVAHAQITLTQADLVGQVTQSSTTTTFETGPSSALGALAAAEGTGQTWDFSTLTFPTTYTAVNEVVQPPVLGSDDPHLGEADFIVRTHIAEADSSAFLFYDLNETSLMLRGASAEGEVNGEPGAVLLRILPGNRVLTFPLAFESAWTDDYELQITPVIEQVRLEQREENEVVGWGTLVTPSGSAEALMLRTRTLQTFSIVSTDPDTSFVVDQDSSISITYVSRTGLGASIELDGLGNVEGGSYTIQSLGGSDIQSSSVMMEAT